MARWSLLQAQAHQPTIGQSVDDAMVAIEPDNPALKDVLPKDYARLALDKTRLGQLIDLVSNIKVGNAEARSKDVLGRVYEYFLKPVRPRRGKEGRRVLHAAQRGQAAGALPRAESTTPAAAPPACSSSRLSSFGPTHPANGNGGRAGAAISIYGQESNYTTWRLAKMNLAIRGIEGQIAHGDSFHSDRHSDPKADYILANPPFNISDWGGERLQGDKRWQDGAPPKSNANFACMVDRTHRELTDDNIAHIIGTYHAWRGEANHSLLPHGEGQGESHADVPGFSRSASLDEVRKHGHVLTPGRCAAGR